MPQVMKADVVGKNFTKFRSCRFEMNYVLLVFLDAGKSVAIHLDGRQTLTPAPPATKATPAPRDHPSTRRPLHPGPTAAGHHLLDLSLQRGHRGHHHWHECKERAAEQARRRLAGEPPRFGFVVSVAEIRGLQSKPNG